MSTISSKSESSVRAIVQHSLASDARIVFDTTTDRPPGDANVAEAVRLCQLYDTTGKINNDPVSSPAVYGMSCGVSFGSNKSHSSGFTLELNPMSAVCRDVITNDCFCGCIAGVAVDLTKLKEHCASAGLDVGEYVRKSLAWACPIVSNSWKTQKQPPDVGVGAGVIMSQAQLGGPRPDEFWLDSTTIPNNDKYHWKAGLDVNGFATLYERDGIATGSMSKDGLLVVCVRTTQAACDLYRLLGKRSMFSGRYPERVPTYLDIATSDIYNRILHLSVRNAQRLLYQASLALGLVADNVMPDLWATDIKMGLEGVYPTLDQHGSTLPPVTAPSPELTGTCNTLDSLTHIFKWQPMLVVPDILHTMDVFVPTLRDQGGLPDVNTVYYHNMVFHTGSKTSIGPFPSAIQGIPLAQCITLYPRDAAISMGVASYHDGCIEATIANSASALPSHIRSPHPVYRAIATHSNQIQ